jgi:hypothetical protein
MKKHESVATPPLRPEALLPVRSALPLLLALATALLAGVLGGFLMHAALPGPAAARPPARAPAVHRVPVPSCEAHGGGLFHRVPTAPDRAPAL